MKVLDFVKNNKDIIEVALQSGITSTDVYYLPYVEAYNEMRERGFKATFIVAYLVEKHKISETRFYRALRKFRNEIDGDLLSNFESAIR